MGLTGWGYYQSYGAMYAFDESAAADVVAGYVLKCYNKVVTEVANKI